VFLSVWLCLSLPASDLQEGEDALPSTAAWLGAQKDLSS
jgi:hypothetical protein